MPYGVLSQLPHATTVALYVESLLFALESSGQKNNDPLPLQGAGVPSVLPQGEENQAQRTFQITSWISNFIPTQAAAGPFS